MPALTTPLVLLPRYSTFAGQADFTTVGLDVSEFSAITLSVWRGPIVGPAGAFQFNLQGSLDQKTWGNLLGSDQDPGANTEETYEFSPIRLPYLRMIVKITGASTVVSCYAVGQLVARRE